jgi:integrase
MARDVSVLQVPRVGRVEPTGDPLLPWRLLDPYDGEVGPVAEFLRDMLASDASAASLRSYAYELLAWFRFLAAVGVVWDRAGRVEARDFALWLSCARKHRPVGQSAPAGGSAVNPVTGKRRAGQGYAVRTRRHARAVVRSFYEYQREVHGWPLVNPFPKAAVGLGDDLNAHHNPMQPFTRAGRRAPYQPRVPRRLHRGIPDEAFNLLFAALSSDRDRALIAFYISSAARASELLSVNRDRVNPGDQLIGVVRKGTRALQWLPASTDAFVWLRLYQQQMRLRLPKGSDRPLWWTLTRPARPLSYDAVRMTFTRANAALGANWTLHDLRHTALQRMVRDPQMSLSDVQWVAGHAHLSTTEIYLEPSQDQVVAAVLAHQDGLRHAATARPAVPAPGYRPEVMTTLLGRLAGGPTP